MPNISFSLSPGSFLGPYRIIAALGAGGMGEVYRAHDPRLSRDVALKVLRGPALDSDQLARFSREARAAGSLNHPNIVAVFDVGTDGGVPYVVTELLEGETLRDRLDHGPLPYRKAVEYGIQIAQALDAAHAKGIWHRDVKPANAFITADGRVKLLDFGIAKLSEGEGRGPEDSTAETRPGEIRGTAGYMSPEQVLGATVDHRSDIFALGAVLYEMFTGARAFERPSTVQTMSAVLQEDPVDPLTLNARLPAAAAALVRRCLEKNREERLQSARDLAFDLQQLRDVTEGTRPVPTAAFGLRRKAITAVVVVALLIGGIAIGTLLQRPQPPTFEQLTFHRGRIGGARLVPGGQAVIFSDTRSGVWRLDDLEAGPASPHWLGHPGSDLLAARAGELALSISRRFVVGERFTGTLALVRGGGGTPLPKAENVDDADWDPSGTHLAVASSIVSHSWIEHDGRRLYETTDGSSIRFVRVSRDGRRIAFLQDPTGRGVRGNVMVVDMNGAARTLTSEWSSVRGLAWSPRGDEIWFTAGAQRTSRALRAVDLEGRQRTILQAPGSLTLWDVAPDGRVLLSRDEERSAVIGQPPGEKAERDLSWFDEAGVAHLSADGLWLLFGDRLGMYLRKTDGSPPTRLELKDGFADDLSPDGKKVLATIDSSRRLQLVPTGPGEPQDLPALGIVRYRGAQWFPDGRRILVNGITERDRTSGSAGDDDSEVRSYVYDVERSTLRPLTEKGSWALLISPDGEWAAAVGTDQGITLWPVAGGSPRPLQGTQPGERPVAWSADGRSLWLFRRGDVPAPVFEVDIDTGRRRPWKTLVPPDTDGVYSIIDLKITPTGHAYFYSYAQMLSQLYLVRGLE